MAATDASGALLWRERYTPFGEPMDRPVANENASGYTGHIHDAATGLIYMQARYQDPRIGRFLSSDPVGFADMGVGYFNRYAYVANDPVNAWDPTGMQIVENGRINLTAKVDVSATGAMTALSGAPGGTASTGVAQEVSLGGPFSDGLRLSPQLGPFSPTVQIGDSANLSASSGDTLGAIADVDAGGVSIHFGSVEDVAAEAFVAEGDLASGGLEVTVPSDGSLAGAGVGFSFLGPGLGLGVSLVESTISDQNAPAGQLPQQDDPNILDPILID